MLDRDLSEMYGVETRHLNEQVKRNMKRFPQDFMFQLTSEEFENLKSQFATSRWGGTRKSPYVFTELGVAMLSIEDVFTDYNDINEDTRMQIELINQSLAELHTDKKRIDKPRNRIGFITE